MKKLVSIFLCSFYLFSISGAKLAVHYCHGHFQTITFNANLNEDACCGKKQPMKKNGCCSDKVIEIKVKSEQKISTATTLQSPPKNNFIVAINAVLTAAHLSAFNILIYPQEHSPPEQVKTSLVIRHCNYRI